MATTSPLISREGAHSRDARAPQSHSSDGTALSIEHWTCKRRGEGAKCDCSSLTARMLLACSRLLAPTAS